MTVIRSMSFASMIAATATATVFAQPQISWSSIDGGAAMYSTSGTFQLGCTIGQPDAQTSPVMSGGAFQLTGGFWAVTQACFCLGDLNADGVKDGRDVQRFVACVLSGGDCSCADVDQANGVTIADLSAFVTDLLAGPSCP